MTTSYTHDKMVTDAIWLREHSEADNWGKARTHGYNYLYYHVPNKRERLEMMYRSVGKQYDWELERFRLGKKYPDRGNKRRFIKNFFRFLKHPFGYSWWKTYKWRQAKGRLMVLTITFGMIFTVFKYKVDSYNIAKKNHWLLVSGKNLEGTGTIRPGYDDDRWARQPMPMTSFLYYDLPGYKIVVNPCRDQNYRKYFELRKRYGIKPPNAQ